MELKENLAYIIYFGVFIISFFVITIILFAVVYQRKRILREKEYELSKRKNELTVIKSIVETQESERQKIATNIHDDIGPLVSVLKYHLSEHEASLKKGVLTEEDLKQERKYVDSIIKCIRSTTQDLAPKSLLKYGLVSAIRNFIVEIPGIETIVEEDVDESIVINDTIGINVYRVILELMNNIIKHGIPTKIDVDIVVTKKKMQISILHNGQGISNDDFSKYSETSDGLGISSLKTRTTLLKAELDFQKSENSKVIFVVPLTDEKDD